MHSHGMLWFGDYDYYGYAFDGFREIEREITQMENQRVELISQRNLRNHLRAAQHQPTPALKLVPKTVRPLARNNLGR